MLVYYYYVNGLALLSASVLHRALICKSHGSGSQHRLSWRVLRAVVVVGNSSYLLQLHNHRCKINTVRYSPRGRVDPFVDVMFEAVCATYGSAPSFLGSRRSAVTWKGLNPVEA